MKQKIYEEPLIRLFNLNLTHIYASSAMVESFNEKEYEYEWAITE